MRKPTMGKLILCLVCAMVFISSFSLAESAKEPRSGSIRGINWLLDESGQLIVSGDGDMSKIQLNSDAFAWVKFKPEITSVVLKEGVPNIGSYAFAHCANLKNVTIPGTVTSIGEHAFADCPGLRRVWIPESVTVIADNAFSEEPFYVDTPDKHLVIAGVSGSYAEEYAKAHGITFEDENGEASGMRVSYRKRIEEIVAEQTQPSMTEQQKAKALHDWLIRHTRYDGFAENGKYDMILNDTGGTCGDYAESYSDLLTAAGINNMYVWGTVLPSGMGHLWNLAEIDGQWYHIDPTYDDPTGDKKSNISGYERSDYFMLTDEQMRRDHEWYDVMITPPDPF